MGGYARFSRPISRSRDHAEGVASARLAPHGGVTGGGRHGAVLEEDMADERIEDKLKKMVVARLFMKIPPDSIEEDKSLVDAYGVDSVSLLELVVGLEEEFGIVIGDDEFDIKNYESIQALAAFVRSKAAV